MKTAWLGLILAMAMSTGCVDLPLIKQDKPKSPAKPVTTKAAPPRAGVSPEQVTETNAREKASTLKDELDRDAIPEK